MKDLAPFMDKNGGFISKMEGFKIFAFILI